MSESPATLILVVADDPERRRRLADVAREAGLAFAASSWSEAAARPIGDDVRLLVVDGASTDPARPCRAANLPALVVDDDRDDLDAEVAPGLVRDHLRWDRLTPGRLRRAVRQAVRRQELRDRLEAASLVARADGSERDRLERRLGREVEDLELLQKIVSHDLNEPIAKIVGYADFIVSRDGSRLGDEARRAAGTLREAHECFQGWIDRILSGRRSRSRGTTT